MLLVLFAGLLVFFTIEHYARLIRVMIPIGGVVFFGYLIYAAYTLLRNAKSLDTPATSTDEQCGEGCGCKPERSETAKVASTKTSKQYGKR